MHFRKQNNLFLLCLSNGDFEGLGRVREKELQASAKYLGFQEAECINDPELQDGMK
jgi:N-acetylglucosaminylphosphatidylinositol deacetylase